MFFFDRRSAINNAVKRELMYVPKLPSTLYNADTSSASIKRDQRFDFTRTRECFTQFSIALSGSKSNQMLLLDSAWNSSILAFGSSRRKYFNGLTARFDRLATPLLPKMWSIKDQLFIIVAA